MGFEWDEAKRAENLRKHGVDFRIAIEIFESAYQEAQDDRSDYGERRYWALGQIDGVVLMVVYTPRGENRRIISAWKVDKDGQKRYRQKIGI